MRTSSTNEEYVFQSDTQQLQPQKATPSFSSFDDETTSQEKYTRLNSTSSKNVIPWRKIQFILGFVVVAALTVSLTILAVKSQTCNQVTKDKECNPNPCKNNGTCFSGNGIYSCKCLDGYIGDHCDTTYQTDQICKPNPCHNSGTCFSMNGDYTCKCPVGYVGDNCDLKYSGSLKNLVETSKTNKMHDGVCHSERCQNNGTCLSANGVYACKCADGYIGENCGLKFSGSLRTLVNFSKTPEYRERICYAGVKDGRVKNEDMSASSYWSKGFEAHYGRLDNKGGVGGIKGFWHTPYAGNKPGAWIQVDFRKPTRIVGVITQGRPKMKDDWVTSYKIAYGNTINSLQTIKNNYGSDMIFQGNRDRNTPVTNLFPEPITARYFRLIVVTFTRIIGLRIEYLIC